MYSVVSDLVEPDKPRTTKFKELLQNYSNIIASDCLKLLQIFNFHNCFRNPGESIYYNTVS